MDLTVQNYLISKVEITLGNNLLASRYYFMQYFLMIMMVISNICPYTSELPKLSRTAVSLSYGIRKQVTVNLLKTSHLTQYLHQLLSRSIFTTPVLLV